MKSSGNGFDLSEALVGQIGVCAKCLGRLGERLRRDWNKLGEALTFNIGVSVCAVQ